MSLEWPNNKKFAFTIIDDTDNGTVKNTKPIYDFLYEQGILTTKTVWVYPPRDKFTGGCLLDDDYLDFIVGLKVKGYEIGLHNVGSGKFTRKEIIAGLDIFNSKLGFYPKMQINHASNPDNIYWGHERYKFPLANIIKLIYGKTRQYYGTDISSEHFWGDKCKEKITYIRNYTFNSVNTLKIDPMMPYIDGTKKEYSNYWFSSSDGHTISEFNSLLNKNNIDKLESEGGVCLVYTHLASGFLKRDGIINEEFKRNIKYLSSKNGWFVPASTLLDYLKSHRKNAHVSQKYLARLDLIWVVDRIGKKIRFER